jgi:biopolymer transport protein TolR
MTPSNSWKPKPRRTAPHARIDTSSLTASFAIIFVVFLSVVAQNSMVHHGRYIDLPAITHPAWEPGALRNDALQLAITRNGDFFVSGPISFPSQRLDAGSIPQRLMSLKSPGVERRVYVHADARAKYGDVTTALDAIRYAGLPNVTFIVERYRAAPPPPPPQQR